MDSMHNIVDGTISILINNKYVLWAFIIGSLSAVSLPLGCFFGLLTRPSKGLTSALTAFGGGALLAALTIELVAPTAMAVTTHSEHFETEAISNLIILLFGCIVGGILFVILDQIVNEKGGYLRKSATTIAYFSQNQKKKLKRMLHSLSQIGFLREIPPEHVEMLVSYVKPVTFEADQVIFQQGETGDRLYFIEKGEIVLKRDGRELSSLKNGDVLGEIALITESPRTAQAKARSRVKAIELLKEDFDKIRKESPELDTAVRKIASQRLQDIAGIHKMTSNAASEWAENAASALRLGHSVPTLNEVRESAKEHKGAPLAIWLGIFLDGIPESLVIGAAFLGVMAMKISLSITPSFLDVIPYTLIFGLFLSNFPEAMSSSVGMKAQGWGKPRIFVLWMSLMIMTAIGATAGYLLGSQINHTVFIAIEGVAAGAMLTMIAQTMIPEAVHLGSPQVVGLSTLTGFLSAVAFKLLEGQ